MGAKWNTKLLFSGRQVLNHASLSSVFCTSVGQRIECLSWWLCLPTGNPLPSSWDPPSSLSSQNRVVLGLSQKAGKHFNQKAITTRQSLYMSAATNITWAAYHGTEAMTIVQRNGSGLIHIPFSHQDIHRSKCNFLWRDTSFILGLKDNP